MTGDFAAIPRTRFERKPYWLTASVPAVRLGVPGSHVALPDGRHVWQVDASAVTDLTALVKAAAEQVLSDVALTAAVPHGEPAGAATLTTTLTPHPGGASVQVHAREGTSFRLLFDAVVTAGEPLRRAGHRRARSKNQFVEEHPGRGRRRHRDPWDPNGAEHRRPAQDLSPSRWATSRRICRARSR